MTSWIKTNRRRAHLIKKDIAGTLTNSEREELDLLQNYADRYIEQVAPRPTHVLDSLEKKLKE